MLEVTITEDGEVRCLAPADLDLTILGRVHGRRASYVEWSDEAQAWEVTLPNGVLIGRFAMRQRALDHEVTYLNAKIADGSIEEVFP